MSQILLRSVRPYSYGDLSGRAVGIDSNVFVTSLVGYIQPGQNVFSGSILTNPAAGNAYSHSWPLGEDNVVPSRTSIDVRNIYCSFSADNIDDLESVADRCRFIEFRFYKAFRLAPVPSKFYLFQKGFTTIVGDSSVIKFEDLENINLAANEYIGVEIFTEGTAKSMCAFGLNFDLVMQRVVA